MASIDRGDADKQGSLFSRADCVQSQGFRHTDPITSKLAVEKITKNGARHEASNKILRFLRSLPEETFTYREIAQAIGWDAVDTMRRLNDLRHEGLVKKCPKRECSTNGNLMLTWKAEQL